MAECRGVCSKVRKILPLRKARSGLCPFLSLSIFCFLLYHTLLSRPNKPAGFGSAVILQFWRSHRGLPADTNTTGEAPASDTGMESSNGSSNFRNLAYKERQLQLPPKSTMQCTFRSDASSIGGSEVFPTANGGQVRHQRNSSDSLLLEEPPYWLEELLDEPETPMCRGHRRSSSDSVAFMDRASKPFREDGRKFKNSPAEPSMGSSNFDYQRDLSPFSYHANPNNADAYQKRVWGSPFTSVFSPNGHLSTSNASSWKKSVSSACISQDCDGGQFKVIIQRGVDLEGSSIRSDCSYPSPSASQADLKRAKQQFAQKSRMRKLQYIAELERNVQALQAEGYGVSAELEFLDQQNLILGMENMALKQRLESLSHEQFIKCMEQDMLRREISRLRYLYRQQQQQMQKQKHSTGGRTKTRDLDSQFVTNSIKPKEAGSC
ncbi:hypothetical protein I3843_03G016800 [Carya illinoinensis]|nr:hypothetical protein I3843_03G016800 [Carya illinoinensis]